MGQLAIKVKELVANMADELRSGNISANPVAGACEFCDYRAVCCLDTISQ